MSKYTNYDFVAADRDMVMTGRGYSWRSYTDKIGHFGNIGSEVIFDDGTKDKQGRPIGKAFSINQSHYKLQAREGQKDVNGNLLTEYFKYAPFCLGSPNGTYTFATGDNEGQEVPMEELKNITKNLERLKSGEITQATVKIKMLDNEFDARIALEAGMNRAKAQLSVGQLDEQTLREVGAMVGVFGKSVEMTRLDVYEFAGKRPLDYFKYLESGDRSVRAVIRLSIDKGILSKRGSVIYWDQTVLGGDENAVVTSLLADEAMLKSLQEKLDFKSDKKPKKK